MVKNDYVVDQLNYLEASEKNLTDNMSNTKLLDAFIERAHEVAGNLKKQYGEGWNSPDPKATPSKETTALQVTEDKEEWMKFKIAQNFNKQLKINLI